MNEWMYEYSRMTKCCNTSIEYQPDEWMNVWILGWLNVVLQILRIDHWPDEWLNKWKNVWILGWLNVEKQALILNEWMNAWILGWLNVVLQVLSTEYNLMNEWMHDN